MAPMVSNLILSNLSALEALALTIIGEARGEAIEGQVAVGNVIRNRFYHEPHKYKSYIDVCFETKQFSCWNLNDPNYALLIDLAEKALNGQTITEIHLKQCLWVAAGIADWSIIDNTKGALNYIEYNLFENHRPAWAKNVKTMKQIGNHVFFTAI